METLYPIGKLFPRNLLGAHARNRYAIYFCYWSGYDTWWPERKKIGGRKHFDLSVVSLSAFTYPTQRPQPQQPSDLVVAAALDPFVFGQSLGNVDPQQQPLCVEGYKMSPPPPLYSTLLQRERRLALAGRHKRFLLLPSHQTRETDKSQRKTELMSAFWEPDERVKMAHTTLKNKKNVGS